MREMLARLSCVLLFAATASGTEPPRCLGDVGNASCETHWQAQFLQLSHTIDVPEARPGQSVRHPEWKTSPAGTFGAALLLKQGSEAATRTPSSRLLTSSIVIFIVLLLLLLLWGLMPARAHASEKSDLKWHHKLILLQLACIQNLSQDCMNASLPDISHSLGATDDVICMSLQVKLVVVAALSVVLCGAADWIGRCPVIIIGLVCYSTGALMAAHAPTATCLTLGTMVQGVGECCSLLPFVVARDLFQDTGDRSKFYALCHVAATVASVAASSLGSFIASSVGWNMNFVMLALVGMILLWEVLVAFPETLASEKEAPETETRSSFAAAETAGPLQSMMAALTTDTCAQILTWWVMAAVVMGILNGTSSVLMESYQEDASTISFVVSCLAAVNLLGSAAIVPLLRYTSCWKVMQGAHLLLVLAGAYFLGIGIMSMFMIPPFEFTVAALGKQIFVTAALQAPLRSLLLEPFADSAGTAAGWINMSTTCVVALSSRLFASALEVGGMPRFMLVIGTALFLQQLGWQALGAYRAEHSFALWSRPPTKAGIVTVS
eukprot:TRINITY_DN10006_c0_g2_i1.p1 TRINITY_DN10006_c0_g2~~TRINITY_DN10006_c0_g2_i1.p1  ORF type:complete len:551 (+),score=102.61 TRINITY_DN10006_c0_g2_i1:100-1752(+)